MRIDEKEFNARLEKDRLEAEKKASKEEKTNKSEDKKEEKVEEITIDDFMKVKLICAKVLECEPVPKSDKLLCLQLNDGTDKPRQVVSGIAKSYKPEDLIGKKVVLVSNLKKAKLRGVESCGMILASTVGEKIVVTFLDDEIKEGSEIR